MNGFLSPNKYLEFGKLWTVSVQSGEASPIRYFGNVQIRLNALCRSQLLLELTVNSEKMAASKQSFHCLSWTDYLCISHFM